MSEKRSGFDLGGLPDYVAGSDAWFDRQRDRAGEAAGGGMSALIWGKVAYEAFYDSFNGPGKYLPWETATIHEQQAWAHAAQAVRDAAAR